MGNQASKFTILFFVFFLSLTTAWAQKSGTPSNCPSSIRYCGTDIPSQGCMFASDGSAPGICIKKGASSWWNLSTNKYGFTTSEPNVWMCGNGLSKFKICEAGKKTNFKLQWNYSTEECFQIINGKEDPCGFGAANDPIAQPGSQFSEAKCLSLEAKVESGDGVPFCFCPSEERQIDENRGVKCPPKQANDKPSGDATKAAAVAEGSTLKACAEDILKQADACVNKQKETRVTCEKYAEDNGVIDGIASAGEGALGIVLAKGQMDAKNNIGSNKAMCGLTSLLTSSGASMLNGFAKSCKADEIACTATCKIIREKDITKICEKQADDEFKEPKLETLNAKGKAYTALMQQRLKDKIAESVEYCDTTVKKEQSLAAKALQDALKAQAAAQSCACTNVINDAGECGPTTEQCLADPTLPLCKTNPIAINCELGVADYSSARCECLRNPSSSLCPKAIQAAVSNMGAAITSAGGNGDGGLAGTGGSTGAGFNGNFDMGSGVRAPVSSDESRRGGDLSSGGANIAGGGGGSVSASPGAPGAGNGEGEGEPERPSSTWGAIKSMFGGGSGSGSKSGGNGNAKGGPNGGIGFDPNKFNNPRGLRGVAGGLGFGSKNMDIWKMINKRSVDQDKAGNFFDPYSTPNGGPN